MDRGPLQKTLTPTTHARKAPIQGYPIARQAGKNRNEGHVGERIGPDEIVLRGQGLF